MENVENVVNDKDAIKNSMTPEEYENFELEKMRYNTNKLSYNLGLGAVALSVAAMFISLNSLDPDMSGHGYLTVLKILMNIVILLFGFLSCEKVKVYDQKYSVNMYVFAGVCFARIFWYPLNIIRYWAGFKSLIAQNGGTLDAYNVAVTEYADKLGSSMIGKFVDGSVKSTGYLTANGYVRGIVLIVLLGCAGAMFLVSGLVNARRSAKLNKYLDSIKK